MNKELEEAKKKLRDGIVAYIRAAYKASGSIEIAVIMLAKEFDGIGNTFTEADFADLETPEKKDGEQ